MFNFEAIHWGNGDMWWLLLLPLALVPAWISYELFHRRVRQSFTGGKLVEGMIGGAGFGRRLATFVCVFIALELLSVAAMRPRYGLKDVAIKGAGVDMAIVVDASRSMKVNDVKPDRMGISIMAISHLLDAAAGNRVSLVPFAGISFIQSPLTVDYGVIRQYLNDLRVTDMPVPGTALGRALSTAASSLGVDSGSPGGSAGKAIVVFTDGENHEGEPDKVASELAGKGVRIFTIGVGTPEGQPIPRLDDNGNVIGLAIQDDGVSPVISKLDEELLRKIAESTGGKYYQLASVTGISTVSEGLAADLEAMQKDEYLTAVERLLEERFQYPLAAGLLFLLLPFLWMGGRRKVAGVLVAVVILSAAPASAEPFEHPILATLFNRQQPDVRNAMKLLEEGRYGDALKAFQELAGKLPPAPAIEYDTAIAAMKAGEMQIAAQAIDKAIALNAPLPARSPQRLTDKDLLATRGSILFASAAKMAADGGDRRAALQVYRQAVEAFTSALLLDPADRDLRRNLEIASLSAFPSCASLDDQYETNETAAAAKMLTPDAQTGAFKEQLLLCPANHDWFQMNLREGETLTVSVEKPATPEEQAAAAAQTAQAAQGAAIGGAQAAPQQPKPADVDIEVMAADGTTVFKGKSGRYTWRGTGDSQVVIHVSGPDVEDGVDYVLNTQIIPSCSAGGDDRQEDNDSMDAASQVSDGDLDLRICPLDDDFFAYTLQKDTARQVTLSFEGQDGPFELTVLSGDGTPVDVQTSQAEGRTDQTVVLPKSAAEAGYTIAVSGGGSEGFYRLTIKEPEGNQGDDGKDNRNDDQNQDQQNDRNEERQNNQPQGASAIRQLIDQLDSNQENLDAQEAGRNSTLGDHVPDKDW